MKQFLAMSFALVTLGGASLAFDSRSALACTALPFDVRAETDLIVLGEFVAIDKHVSYDTGKPQNTAILRLNVLRVYQGATPLGNQQAEAFVAEPGQPGGTCPFFVSIFLLGRPAMIALTRTGVSVPYATDRLLVWFLGDTAGGAGSTSGTLAEMYFAGEAPVTPTVLPPNTGSGDSSESDESWNWLPVVAVALLLAPLALTARLRRR